MKNFKKIGFILLLVIIVAQFFSPEKNEGDVTELTTFLAETNPPENVKIILETTCFDCHSNNTTYPWYNSITPVNYWLDHHIEEGKEHLDFTKWDSYSLKKKEHKMDELYEEVEEGEMPLNSYTWTHADANLSEEQIAAVVSWGKSVQQAYKKQLTAK
jgi:mono/diheme cytochrome c family protein